MKKGRELNVWDDRRAQTGQDEWKWRQSVRWDDGRGNGDCIKFPAKEVISWNWIDEGQQSVTLLVPAMGGRSLYSWWGGEYEDITPPDRLSVGRWFYESVAEEENFDRFFERRPTGCLADPHHFTSLLWFPPHDSTCQPTPLVSTLPHCWIPIIQMCSTTP